MNFLNFLRKLFIIPVLITSDKPVAKEEPKTVKLNPVKPQAKMIAKTKYPEQVKLSPQTNGEYAHKIMPKAIVVHDSGGNYSGSIDWTSRIINPSTGKRLYATYHCIIARDGRRTITNEDHNRAYHAGISSFKGKKNLNGWSIGFAFERDSNTEPLQKEAIESAIEYLIPRMKRWGIGLDDVTDHRTIAPNRKVDLNPKEFAKFKKALEEAWNKA
jgi:N-acetyl-anhydromuramyl-L-alanine amidase AmpD